ncbi:hypothetical protein K439DRAFT_1636183 [Ramaria rubella]|nr:hypothetical protein K439DRAFT_1636183 [Ramaria rubella]
MSLLILLLALFSAFVVAAAPAHRSTSQWFSVEWDAVEFTAMSGDFVVPDAPGEGATVWPGLQSDNGVLQVELDSQSGSWSIGNSFYGIPTVPLGSRFTASPGDTVHFSFTLTEDLGIWLCTLSGSQSLQTTFSIPANTMNRAILAVQVSDAPHDFTVTYSDVSITAASAPAAQWCTTVASNGYTPGGYTVNGAIAEDTTCHIEQIILPGSA